MSSIGLTSWRFLLGIFLYIINYFVVVVVAIPCRSPWRRANTRNVSFQSLYGGQFTSSTQLINPQFQVIVASWEFDLLKTSVYKPLKLRWWLLLRLARVKSQIREAPRGNPRSWDLASFYSNQTTGHLHNLHKTFVASPRPVYSLYKS